MTINVVGINSPLAKLGFGDNDRNNYQVLVQSVCDTLPDAHAVKVVSALQMALNGGKICDAITELSNHASEQMVAFDTRMALTSQETKSLAESGDLTRRAFIIILMLAFKDTLNL